MPGAVRSIARGLREVSGVALALWLASVSPNPSRSRLELLVNLCLSKDRNPWWALYAVCTVRIPTSEWVFVPFLFRSFFRHNFDESLLVLRPEARPSRVKAGTERELINDPRRLLGFCSAFKRWTRDSDQAWAKPFFVGTFSYIAKSSTKFIQIIIYGY